MDRGAWQAPVHTVTKRTWLKWQSTQLDHRREESWGMTAAAAAAESLQSCPTQCDPIDGSPPGSPVPGILQARTWEWGCHFLLQCMKVKSEITQSCLNLSNPMDCSLPGSSIHWIFQGRVPLTPFYFWQFHPITPFRNSQSLDVGCSGCLFCVPSPLPVPPQLIPT